MTREEAIEVLENGGWWDLFIPVTTIEGRIEEDKLHEALDLAIAALRPVSREQVEQMRGEWMFKPFYKGTSRGAIECQECKGAFDGSVEFNFCPNCGAPMTDEAVQMVMERLEEMKNG